MASAKLYDFSGELKGEVDLPESLFGAGVNRAVLYQAVKQYLANRRVGSAKTKQRGEVNFSTKKPYRQKGTGRARAGRRSSPIWRKGGVVFGPQPRDFHAPIPKKVKRIALKSALSDKGQSEGVVVVEGVSIEEPKTKRFYDFLRATGLNGKKVLFVTNAFDENVLKSLRNIPRANFILSRNMNAYDIMNADVLMFTREGLSALEEVFS
ncbi:MAG: 50S ribosomal protein L4 [Candidatus Latescibacteria bacterium 4484_7]|nr:MAG: 50S ribosomal protein L4 [Candidatus Latescibacteria bacterium 4484_7]